MAPKHCNIILVITLTTLVVLYNASLCSCQLSPSFYAQTCPKMVSIASSTFQTLAANDNVVSPSVLRLINHDCFIQGCDASILISSTPGNSAERDYVDNNIPQQAFDAISTIKEALESSICPGVVSCADIVILAARDSVVFLGGPSWDVAFGRRDSRTSFESMVEGNIPTSTMNVQEMLAIFEAKGLDVQDLVALSGAHTVGFSACRQFSSRLSPVLDPTMDPTYAQELEQQCPVNGGNNVVPLDPPSPFVFDSSYFKDLEARRGLLFTDQILSLDPLTRDFVSSFASSQSEFFEAFVNSMIKMSSIGVLTGNNGEIRRVCSVVNSS